MNNNLYCTEEQIISSSISFPKQKYRYNPQPDITAYELALIVPVFGSGLTYYMIDELVDKLEYGAKRHFEEMK